LHRDILFWPKFVQNHRFWPIKTILAEIFPNWLNFTQLGLFSTKIGEGVHFCEFPLAKNVLLGKNYFC
jgi:hemolysin-activating ACP:hemolysin acyltransferase